VQRYYGETLQSSEDLKTDVCCTSAAPPDYIKGVMAEIHPDVSARYYGCGLVLPEALEGMRILDLGCGAGRDVYLLSRLAGATGFVVGVDMTAAQLDVARKYQDWHAQRFGYAGSNVEFVQANIEELQNADLEAGSFDLIVSNCVINLAMDKQAVLDSAFSLLRPGGEMYFADIYVDRRVPDTLRNDPVLYGECLSGALYWNDFLHVAEQSGFAAPRLVEQTPVTVTDPEIKTRIDGFTFWSATCRLFKAEGLESSAEDYGQQVQYLGSIPEFPDTISFDREYQFATTSPLAVCGNTYKVLQQSRLAPHFRFIGDTQTHHGKFSSNPPEQSVSEPSGATVRSGGSCC
ncbi:MAG: methyltransferase domain-containing protein, partial [Gammaproteobacteria bacterium]